MVKDRQDPCLMDEADALMIDQKDIKSLPIRFKEQHIEQYNDFFCVRQLSKDWLYDDKNTYIDELALRFRFVLRLWCRPRDGTIKNQADIAKALADHHVKKYLVFFEKHKIDNIKASHLNDDFNHQLMSAMNGVSSSLFDISKEKVSLAMLSKAVLLLTGFMPAIDSEGTKGLKEMGSHDLPHSRYPVSDHKISKKESQKIIHMIRSLIAFRDQHEKQISKTLKDNLPELTNEMARFFDILFSAYGKKAADEEKLKDHHVSFMTIYRPAKADKD